MLGHPDPVQGDCMEEQCQLVSHGISTGEPGPFEDPGTAALRADAKDWRLLLQLETDEETGWQWGDDGTIYFWIREQDAQKGDFSKVWMILQCG